MFKAIIKSIVVFFILVTCNSCINQRNSVKGTSAHSDEVYAIKNVSIIPMTTDNKIISHATIVIGNKKILSNRQVPSNAKIIDGTDLEKRKEY